MTDSQNGWSLLYSPGSKYLHDWTIPARNGTVNLPLRRGPAGFLLAHYLMWHSEVLEPVAGKGDDFGWSKPRKIGGSDDWSNHGSGTAADINSSLHPQGENTFKPNEVDLIHHRLGLYDTAIRWGGDYHSTIDQMHFEINLPRVDLVVIAQALVDSVRGSKILLLNDDQRQYIMP